MDDDFMLHTLKHDHSIPDWLKPVVTPFAMVLTAVSGAYHLILGVATHDGFTSVIGAVATLCVAAAALWNAYNNNMKRVDAKHRYEQMMADRAAARHNSQPQPTPPSKPT
jgi:hypothetical protein